MHEQGKPRPHETIRNAYRHITPGNPPPGYHEGSATFAELQAAGFHGGTKVEPTPGTAPADELLVAGQQIEVGRDEARSILAGATFRVLRDPSGRIVATWDEGRWWTAEESAAFTAALVAELEGDE